MKNTITLNYSKVSQTQAREIFKKRGIGHVYGEASSVSYLGNNKEIIHPSGNPYVVGIITMEDLGLHEDKKFTMNDVLQKCEEQKYEKPVFSDLIRYIDKLENRPFRGSQTAIMSIMNEVMDGEACMGRVYIQPDEDGYIERIGFIQIDPARVLSKTAKFFVKKIKD